MLFNHCIPPAKQFLHKSCLPSEQHDLYNEDLKQALKKQNALATTQRTVVNAWRDGPFLAMAVDFDWFVLKDWYWNNLRRVSKRYPWPEAVSRLNYAFFMRHVVSNDWQKVQSEGVAKSTLEDPEELTSTMKVKEVIERVSASMDEADPASFQPVNCLDLQTLPSYAHEPSFMTHPRYSLLDVVRVRLQQKLGTFVPIGKQTWKSPLRSTVSRPVDMEQAMHFQLLSSQYTVSNFHEDVMNCTWVKCLAGVKAWFFDLSDQRDDISDVPDGNNQQAAVTYSSGVKLVILKPGDILYMPAGLIVRHAVVTLEGPCVMVGGQKLDGCSLPEQLECMESLMEEPARTNESVPCLQLPDVLDEIISYIMNGPDPDMINADETRSRLRASLVEIRARLSTKLGFQADDALAGAETMTLNSRIGNASMSHGKPSVILYQRLQDASLRICDLPVC
ncbi:hypothetical protein KCU78_g1441, partial [Aureobasidium melanogenum]